MRGAVELWLLLMFLGHSGPKKGGGLCGAQ
jgi:hypothetical protein